MGAITRRSLLKGAAIGAVGATTASLGLLAGCSSTETSSASANEASAAGESSERVASPEATYGSILNPQEDFSAATTDYNAIFSPLELAHVTLKNRLVKSCAGSEMQKSSDWPDDSSLRFYEQFLKGDIGMICVEPSVVIPGSSFEDMFGDMAAAGAGEDPMPSGDSPMDMPAAAGGSPSSAEAIGDAPADTSGGASATGPGQLDLSTDEGIEAHKVMADLAHSYDIPLIAQMYDMMMPTGCASTFHEDSKLESAMSQPKMQTTEQVNDEQRAFVDAAERYKKAGWDGIELNASCNHYFSTYLSRYANRERTDQYSAESVENRARILTEIIEGIRERIGDDFIIQVLYSGIEGRVDELGEDSLCTTVEEAVEMARIWEKAGATCLHVRSELYGHHCAGFMPDVMHYHEHGDTGYASVIDYGKHLGGLVIGKYDGVGALLEVAAKIKSAVSIPVGVVGSMDPRVAPDMLNNAIAEGKVDYFLLNRPLMADPQLSAKLKEGRRDEVAPCTRCMTCFSAPFEQTNPMYCRVNPAITRAYSEDMPEGYEPVPATESKKVMVIGGGPAGMEAARIAAQRGHEVALYEKNADFGGLMDLARKVKGPHERIADYKAYLIRQLEVTGVESVTGKEIDADFVASESPDAVIVAVGGRCDSLPFSAPTSDSIRSIESFYDARLDDEAFPVGETVVVYGAQLQACDFAEYLAKQGKSVAMVNPGSEDDVYLGGPLWPRYMGKAWLDAKGVKIYHHAHVTKLTESDVSFIGESDVAYTLAFDTFIDARPLTSNRELFEAVQTACPNAEVQAVGDCYSPSTIANGVARANIIARRVGDGGEALVRDELAENQYRATATGIGDVTVTITVDAGKITAATVDTSNESAEIGRPLGTQFGEQIVANGTIDAVSGATLTSTAAESALAECRAQAKL